MKVFLRVITALFFLAPTASFAAAVISIASGNIGTAGTWALIEPNTFLNSETANTALTTSFTGTNTLTPGAVTVQGIAVKLASVATAPTGTMTCRLVVTSGLVLVDQVVINVSDLVTAAAAAAEGGWVVFEFGSTHLLTGATPYEVQCETSSSAQVNLFSSATTVWSQMLIETATQAPVAGDSFYVFGQLTGAGTHNAFTVTINTTANVNYGNVANTLVSPSISVGQYGTLAFATTASTAFLAEFAGPEVTYNGGTFTIGTSGTLIPSTSSATLTLNSTVEGDTGINTRNGGTFDAAGSSGGRNVVKTKLTAQATAATTSTLTTADSTGWLSGDSIYIAGTTITTGSVASYKGEAGTLTSNATGASVPLTGAVTNTHTAVQLSYTSSQTGIAYSMNMYADVVLLNRNVIIQGSGTTTNAYLYFQANSVAAMTWVEFSNISGLNAGKLGVEVDTGPAGSFSLTNFSIINSHNSSLVLAGTNTNFGGIAGTPVFVQHGVIYNDATAASGSPLGLFVGSTLNPYWEVDDVAVILCANGIFSANAVSMASQNGQFTNISVTGSGNGSTGALVLGSKYTNQSVIGGQVGNVWGPLTFYTNIGYVWTATASFGLTGAIAGIYIWHEQGRFVPGAASGGLTIDPFYLITSGFGIYDPSSGGNSITVRNGVIGWDGSGTASSAYPLTADSVNNSNHTFDNMELCPNGSVGGVTFIQCASGVNANNLISLMHDITVGGQYVPSNSRVFLRNTSLASGVGANWPTLNGEEAFFNTAFVVQDCAACTPVKHGAWVAGGYISYDTAITHTSGYSERMTPKVGTFSGYILGTSLTATASKPYGDSLTSNGSGFVSGTVVISGSGPYVVSQSQTVGNSGSPVQFQNYYNTGSLLRMQSAPKDMGVKVAVKSGVSNAQACVWLRPSINTDAAPLWGGSAVTYNGDNPRMIVRQNPYMGVQADTVIATSSPTAGVWGQFCGTLPTAPADGEFEVVIDADQTFTSTAGGSINIAEPSCTNCGSINGSQFWWNGVPFAGIAPTASGSGGGTNGIGTFKVPLGP